MEHDYKSTPCNRLNLCLFGITRTLVIIINLIITALACLLIFVSFNAFDQDYVQELDSSLSESQPKLIHTYVSIICAGLGLIIALLSLLGLVGAVRKSKSILGTYAAIISFMLLLLLAMVVVTFTINNKSSTYKEIDKSFVNSTVVVYNYVDSGDMKTRIIDRIQKSFTCCGVNSPNDWMEYSLHKIPKSCCSEPIESSLPRFKYCADSDYKTGCWKALTDYFNANLASVRALLWILIAFGLICISAACSMIRTLSRNSDVV